MRQENPYKVAQALPRMVNTPKHSPECHANTLFRQSWSPKNLYNLHERSSGSRSSEVTFKTQSKTLFQQLWTAKKLVRGYHGDFLGEGRFQRYLPSSLPALAEPQHMSSKKGKERAHVPVASLMFAQLEARLDVAIFRACFAPSVYRARQMVIHSKVTVDGDKVRSQ